MDNYQERSRARVALLAVLAGNLCEATNAAGARVLLGFTPEPPREEPSDWYAALIHADGRRIGLHLSAEYLKGPQRIEVTGDYPNGTRGEYKSVRDWYVMDHGETAPTITVSAARRTDHIAADIARRFLPRYTELYRLCEGRRNEARAYEDGRAAAVGELLARIGDAGKLDGGRDERDPHVHVTMTDTCYGALWPDRVELRSCTPALVADIAGVIAGHVRRGRAE